MTIGEKIRAAREAKGLTIDELSSISGVDNRHIGKYEENEMMPRYTTLNKLADALDVKITSLYNDDKDNADSEAAEGSIADISPDTDEPIDIRHSFAERFRIMRMDNRVSIRQLSQAIDVPKETLRSYECEEAIPDIVTVEKLARYFDVTTDFILGKPFLTKQDSRFLKFVNFVELLTELHISGSLPTELYVLCRNALVADFI